MGVNRCICWNVPFTELKRIADETGADLNELARRTGASTGCGMCRPYIKLMLETGRTDLPVLDPNERIQD